MAKDIVEYKPGDLVPELGVYRVIHDPNHTQPHDVTCIEGRKFPPCRDCHHPHFVMKHPAVHIEHHPMFH